ncbi:MAG TPA: glycosyltransferase family 2 protein [Verrucomicrobiae bacterium]|nr:glycosyltransferase family 2 protein [Verrucomicrobiae bacterium]
MIIATYCRPQWIARSLQALAHQEVPSGIIFETIVVDDGSPNVREIEDIVRDAPLTVKFVSQANGGPASARNRGVLEASGEVLCFLDDDSIADPRWLQKIVEPFRGSAAVGIVSGLTCSYDRHSLLPLILERSVYPRKSWATCNIAYRADIFRRLGGFDERFREASWEDNDLGLRVRWEGERHVFTAGAVVYHPHEGSLDEFRAKCYANGRGAAVFVAKWFRKKPLWAVAVPLLMARRIPYGILPRARRREISPEYLKFMWSYYSLKGFLQVISGSTSPKD